MSPEECPAALPPPQQDGALRRAEQGTMGTRQHPQNRARCPLKPLVVTVHPLDIPVPDLELWLCPGMAPGRPGGSQPCFPPLIVGFPHGFSFQRLLEAGSAVWVQPALGCVWPGGDTWPRGGC